MTTKTTWTIEAAFPRTSDACPDTDGAMDLDVTVTVGDQEWTGEVTLVPRLSDGALDSWGSPDHWISADLLRKMHTLSDADFRGLCGDLAATARTAAEGEGRYRDGTRVEYGS